MHQIRSSRVCIAKSHCLLVIVDCIYIIINNTSMYVLISLSLCFFCVNFISFELITDDPWMIQQSIH